MGIFRRRKNKSTSASTPAATAPSAVPGIPTDVLATDDFDIIVRHLINQMVPAGTEVEELGDDTIAAGNTKHYLGNLRKTWHSRDPEERNFWLRNAIAGMHLSELRDQSELDLSMLRPGMRSQWYLNASPMMAHAEDPDSVQMALGPASRPLGPGLARVLIWDTPTTMSLISESQIEEWGSDFERRWEVAVHNLVADPATEGWGRANDAVWMPIHSDDYTGARPLCPRAPGPNPAAGRCGDLPSQSKNAAGG